MAARQKTLFSLSPEEIALHVDGDGRIPFAKTFRGKITILTAVILALSWAVFFLLFPALLGRSIMAPAAFALGVFPYLALVALVLVRYQWAILAWGAYFVYDQLLTIFFLAENTGQVNAGSLVVKVALVIYALSLSWKAFLVERELAKREAASLTGTPPAA